MQEKEKGFYEKIGNWDFSQIKYQKERSIDWEFYQKIKENTTEKSLCLDLGTGGGEKTLEKYPNVGMIIATDFSKEMIKTAILNSKKYPYRNIKFCQMDNLNITFPSELFDLVSARHTIIDAKQIYNVLKPNGILVIEGVDKKDCLDLKDIFCKGQAYNDKISIAEKDYNDIKEAGFSKIEKVEILENEYYETEEDLIALLLKVPILDDFSEINENVNFEHLNVIDRELLRKYIEKHITERGILLKRVSYGIIAVK